MELKGLAAAMFTPLLESFSVVQTQAARATSRFRPPGTRPAPKRKRNEHASLRQFLSARKKKLKRQKWTRGSTPGCSKQHG